MAVYYVSFRHDEIPSFCRIEEALLSPDYTLGKHSQIIRLVKYSLETKYKIMTRCLNYNPRRLSEILVRS